jgi:hypothetical protein
MNIHQQRVEDLVALAKQDWDLGFIEHDGTWEQFEKGLRADLATLNAAELTEHWAVVRN